MPEQTKSRYRLPLLLSAAIVVVAAAVFALTYMYGSPALSPGSASATAEARQFATAEVARQATAVAVRRTATARAHASGTAQAVAVATGAVRSSATAQAQAYATGSAQAQASAVAPSTQTAVMVIYEAQRARAEATVTSMVAAATVVYAPQNGALDHNGGGTPTCAESTLALQHMIVSARFFNPYSAAGRTWDYGISLTNEGQSTRYSFLLRSSSNYAVQLSGPAFVLEHNNSTDLIDQSRAGDNTIQLYIIDNTAHLFLNNVYLDTWDLEQIGLGQAVADLHVPMLCANLDEESGQPGAATRYEAFTVWQVP